MIKNALISVYHKEGIYEFALALNTLGVKIMSSSKTAQYLRDKGINVEKIEDITGFLEIMNGRVKTLHPFIHAGILARRSNTDDMETLRKMNIKPIDMVVVNLYPFFEKAKEGLSIETITDYIDIGGPTMIRAAAKNFGDVVVVVDKNDYQPIIDELKSKGNIDIQIRRRLAFKAFNLTAAYDAAISSYFQEERYPKYFNLPVQRVDLLRYGENPHQSAAVYKNMIANGATLNFEQISGMKLSYNNYRDADIAWKIVSEFNDNVVCCGLKHSSPCGVAVGEDALSAYKKMYSCDPISIFGGIVAFNTTVDYNAAIEMKKLFFEVLIAPDYTAKALEVLKKKKKLRILKAKFKPQDDLEILSVDGGFLVQERDRNVFDNWEVVTNTKPDENLIEDLKFAYTIVKYAKSNSIVVSKDLAAIGIGGGQTNRIWAAKQALERAKNAEVLASDGFFPFDDVVKEASKYSIRAIIQPGGSIRDKDSIKACNENGIAMIFTKTRHFKH